MTYQKEYTAKAEHIDVQDIMDGLYYPFYMEDCRHAFIKDVMGMDIAECAKQGINLVLSQYTIRFLRPLKKDDPFTVSCALMADADGKPKFYFKQTIVKDGKLMTEAEFIGVCVPAAGGRPYIPETLQSLLQSTPVKEAA